MKFSIAALVGFFLASCAAAAYSDDIVDVAIGNGSFGTLVTALVATGLDTALSEPNGPFTVFAPTDDAFAAVEMAYPGILGCLLEDTGVLSSILLYHVVSGTILSTDLTDGAMPVTLNGAPVTVDLSNGVKIDDATVIIPDVMASNGVIHAIDSVLLPPAIVAALPDFYAGCIASKGKGMMGKKGGIGKGMIGKGMMGYKGGMSKGMMGKRA